MSLNVNHDIAMGCDFYTFYNLCIRYKRDNEVKVYKRCLEDTKRRNDWWGVEHDEDFEELEDYRRKMEKQKDQLDYELDKFPTVHLCVEGEWKCVASAKEKIHTGGGRRKDRRERNSGCMERGGLL